MREELKQLLLSDDVRVFADVLGPVIKFLSGVHNSVNPSLNTSVTFHDLLEIWYELEAIDADFPEVEDLSGVVDVKTIEIPPLEELLQEGTSTVHVWSSRLNDLSKDLIDKNKGELNVLPSRLRGVARHSLREVGCHLELATLGIEMIAEALEDRDGDKLTLALQNCYRGLIHLCGQFSVDCKRIVCRVLLLGHSWRYALVTNHDIRPFSSDRNSDRKGEQGRYRNMAVAISTLRAWEGNDSLFTGIRFSGN